MSMTSFAAARLYLRILCLGTAAQLAAQANADVIHLAEPFTDQRVFATQSQISTTGTASALKTGGGREELELKATVNFDFRSRRLPPAGRDAEALREAREFLAARLVTTVSKYETKVDLPANQRLIIANGSREGIVSYCPQGPLTRETVDLLEIPGDPLTLLALLPATDVHLGEEWVPADWVLQMLTGLEAVETSELKCQLEQATPTAAKIVFKGKTTGQRLGTNTSVEVSGALIFNREENYLSQAKSVYTIISDVGAVNPGLNMKVTAVLARKPTDETGSLTDASLASIPLQAPADLLRLTYQASPWKLELSHSRDWHLFQAIYDGGAPVAILRLVELGSLVAQCNLSPAPPAAPGQTTPLERFESDIEQSLGERFGEIVSRERVPTDDGRLIYRVVASGNVVIKSTKGRSDIPMNWIYYLVAHPQGRQASFVFSVEPPLLDQLKNRDRDLVLSLRFMP